MSTKVQLAQFLKKCGRLLKNEEKAIMHAVKGFSVRSRFEAILLQMMYQEQYLIHFSKNLQYFLFAMVQHLSTKKERVLILRVNQEGNCYNKTSALSVHNGQSCYDNHWSLLMESGRHQNARLYAGRAV